MARRKRSLLSGSLKSNRGGTSLVAKTPCSHCRVPGSIPCQGTRSHVVQLKIPCAATKRFHMLPLSRGPAKEKKKSSGGKRLIKQIIMWTKCETAVLIRLKDRSTMTACIRRFFSFGVGGSARWARTDQAKGGRRGIWIENDVQRNCESQRKWDMW